MTTCRECGSAFDLAAQPYYDSLCPDCVEPERKRHLCFNCSERIPPEELTSVGLVNRSGRRAGQKDYVAVHEGECESEVRAQQSPTRP